MSALIARIHGQHTIKKILERNHLGVQKWLNNIYYLLELDSDLSIKIKLVTLLTV